MPSRPLARVMGLRDFLTREDLYVVFVAFLGAFVAWRLPEQLRQDSWLSLVSGREVAAGLPHHHLLTAWAHGERFVDQQWLAHWSFYRLEALAGIKLPLIVHLGLTTGAIALAFGLARRLGGSAQAAFVVGVVALPSLTLGWQMRAQSWVLPLFVALLYLLAKDSRAPSRQVLFALPLLVLWANLHGSVLLAASLVVLRGLFALRSSARWRGVALLGAPLTILATPYGLGIWPYYQTVFSAPLGAFVTEWQLTTLSARSLSFFVLAFACVFVLARRPRDLTGFECAALGLLLLAGLVAERNMGWFNLAALLLLPRPLEALLARRRRPDTVPRSLRQLTAGTALVVFLAALVFALARPGADYYAAYPPAVATLVAETAAQEDVLVFATEDYADWLLWQEPALAGRVVYDVRLELLSEDQLASLFVWRNALGPAWEQVSPPGAVIVAPRGLRATAALLAQHPTILYQDADLVVLRREQA